MKKMWASPMTYVALYFLLILFFAIIYTFLPARSFYHSTSQFEYQFLNNDANTLIEELRIELIDRFIASNGRSFLSQGAWSFDINDLQIMGLDVENFPKEIILEFRIELRSIANPELAVVQFQMGPQLSVKVSDRAVMDGIVYSPAIIEYTRLPASAGIPPEPNASVFFPSGNPFFENRGDTAIYLPITQNLYARLLSFGEGFKGFPSGVSGQFERMLYFSAGVASSTALGDISPITSLSRFLVTIQAMITVFVVSVFFITIGSKISETLDK